MSSDDISDLEFGEIVEVTFNEDTFKGKVRGIDTWSLKVRVEVDEENCRWFPPRIVKRLNEDGM